MTNFKEKYGPWAVVAGASEGLGAAFATAIAQRGFNLVLIARRADVLSSLAAELTKAYGVEVSCHTLDLADTAKTQAELATIQYEIGLLVYNAAYAPINYFEDLSEQQLLNIADVNVRAPLLLTKHFSKNMLSRGKGGIVLMSSLSGAQGSPKIATYAATKSFNTVLAQGLWSEMRNQGVDVIASCAGAIRTPGYIKSEGEKEAPGTLDASEVANETLDALGKGPTVVPGKTNKLAHFFMTRILSKKQAIAIMDKNTKSLS